MSQRIGDDIISDRNYRTLRGLYKAARTTTPWESWAKTYLSEGGARDRELVKARETYESKATAAAWDGIEAQRKAMDAELEPDTAEVRALKAKANERDEISFEYTPAAVAAQSQLAALGVAPRRRAG
jgi:hypothetical protein